MAEIRTEGIDPQAVFTPEYWGEYAAGDVQAISNTALPRIPITSIINLVTGVCNIAMGQDTPGPLLAEGTVVDFTNPEAGGRHHLPGGVLVVERERLTPASLVVGEVPDKPASKQMLTVPPRSLIRARTDFSDDGRKVIILPGEVAYTDGESVYQRLARVVGVFGSTSEQAMPIHFPRLAVKQTRRGIRHTATSIPLPDMDLLYRHEVRKTSWLPGGILSRVCSVEILAAGEVVEAKDRSVAKDAKLAWRKH